MPIFSRYENFDLEIEALGKDYRTHVIASPVGQVDWTPFSLLFSSSQLQQARALFGRVRNLRPVASSEPALDPKVFGAQLYNTVFGGEIGRCLNRSLERVGSETGLRIRLRLNNAPNLADLPWEYLCAPPPFDFFALSARTPIVRYLATQSAETPLTATLPLRILAVIANPSSREFPALDVEAEWIKLQAALADLLRRQLVVLERLAAPTLDALSQRLRTTTEKEPVHLLHFIGHGATNVLLFEDTAGNPHLVAADVLGKILREHRWLRLVFLNACEGGRSDEHDIFLGVAPQLVQQEVPAVIAMKYAVTDHAAIELASQFYAAIADGYPVDAALAEARRAIYARATSVEWGTPLLFMRSTDSALIDPLDLATIPACPYPGMVPFSAKDARFFFGRQAEIDAMRRHLRHQNQLFVIGPSGSGKSSLVFAGLLPALEMQDAGKWQVRMLRPGAAPQAALQEAVGDLITFEPSAIRKSDAIGAPQLLLVVDQFEELFVQNSKADQNAFIAQLKAVRQLAGVILVITMRADFYPDLMNSDFWPVDGSQRMEIAPLRGDALRAAIEQPARAVKVTLESGLVERLLADAADEPGVLPLLQETMILLWDEQKRRVLPLAAYHALGTQGRSGLAVAMATKADATLANLSPAQQMIARRIFLRLVQFGEGRSDTRRQQSLNELHKVADEASLVDETLKQLVENRLLTLSGESSDPERKVDIAHEMLIVGWPTSQSWVQSRREAELTRRRLEEKAKEWVRLGSNNGGLLDEAELAEAERWMTSPDASDLGYSNDLQKLTETSRHEIQKAVDEKKAAEAEKRAAEQQMLLQAQQLAEEQRQRAEDQKKLADEQRQRAEEQTKSANQLRRRAWWLAAAGVVALVAALGAGWFGIDNQQKRQQIATQATAVAQERDRADTNAIAQETAAADARQQQEVAEEQAAIAHARQLAAQAQNEFAKSPPMPALGLLLALEAIDAYRTPSGTPLSEVETTLHELLGKAGGIKLTDDNRPIRDVAFNPRGRWLAIIGSDQIVRLWDIAHPNLTPVILNGPGAKYSKLEFSPDGKWLAAISADKPPYVWDITQPDALPVILDAEARAEFYVDLLFSPDGQWLVSSQDETVRLWKTNQLDIAPIILQIPKGQVRQLAFSPTGKWLATADELELVYLWNMEQIKAAPITLRGAHNGIYDLEFSPDGAWLASAEGSGSAHLWRIDSNNSEVTELPGHYGNIYDLAFSPDGAWLATGDVAGKVRLWSVAHLDDKPTVLLGHRGSIYSMAFSHNGHWLAVDGGGPVLREHTVFLWDMWNLDANPILLRGHEATVRIVEFSPDDKWLVTASADNTARLWSIAQPITDPIVLSGLQPTELGVGYDLSFSPDGEWLSATQDDNVVRVWSMLSPNADPVLLYGHEAGTTALAFSPDKKWLATASWDNRIRLWNLTKPYEESIELAIYESDAYDLAFSPNKRWLAAASQDGIVRLWDVAQPQVNPNPEQVFEGGGLKLAFSPDGQWLASTGLVTTTVRLWNVTLPNFSPMIFIGHKDYINDLDFSPDNQWLATASRDKTVRLWRVTQPDARPTVLEHESSVNALAFSHDRHWLATASFNTVRLWNMAQLDHPPVIFIGHQDNVAKLAFSSDSTQLATASWDTTVRLWSVMEPEMPAIVLNGHQDAVYTLAFTPDGQNLASLSKDGTIRIWTLQIKRLIELACRTAGRNLNQKEWEQYLPNKPYHKTCPMWS